MSSKVIAEHKQTINGHTADVNGLAFNQNSFATCSSDKTVRIWSMIDYSELPSSPLCAHTYSVHACTYSPNGQFLATCSTDGKCILWHTYTWKKVHVFEHPSKASIRICRFSPSGDLLATGSDDETVCLWNVSSKKLLRSFSGQEASILALAFSPDNAFLVTGTPNGDLCLWDAMYGHGKYLMFISEGHDLGVSACVFSPTYGSAGAPSQGLVFQTHFLLATCGFDSTIKLWDIMAFVGSSKVTMQLRDTLSGHTSPVLACTFSHDGKIIASGSSDHTIRLWDPAKTECLQVADAHSRYVTSVAFSIDDQYLASGSNDKTVKIWKIVSEHQEQGTSQDAVPTAPLIDLNDLPLLPEEKVAISRKRAPPQEWSVEDVCKFIDEIGLSEYRDTFSKNAIDGTELFSLDDATLQNALGIRALGHRNKILRSIEYIHAHPMKQPQTPKRNAASEDSLPDEFLCPITREVMKDPVIAADGYTYEKAAIISWFESGNTTSPMTNSPLQNFHLNPNRNLKMLIQKK